MNERVKRLSEEIRKLPPEEQAELIDELIVLTSVSYTHLTLPTTPYV